jgi:hypothetical protein
MYSLCLIAGRKNSSGGTLTDTELPCDVDAWSVTSGASCLGYRMSMEAEGDEQMCHSEQ